MRRPTKTGNGNDRGSAYKRRELKTWMLAEFGDGITVECAFGCGKRLFYSEMTKDRYPIPGWRGGKYIKGNVRPACARCNAKDGALQLAARKTKEQAQRLARNARRRELYAARRQLVADITGRP